MKKLAIPFVILVAIGVIAVYWLSSNIDRIVKEQIETVGSELTGVTVTVEQVKIHLGEGAGKITGLVVSNPAGYITDHAFKLTELKLDLGLLSLARANPLVVEKLVVDSLEANLELKESTTNLTEISQAIQNNTEQAEEKTQSNEDGEPVTLGIQDLLISGVTLTISDEKKTTSRTLPTISMQNIGGDAGAAPARVSAIVLTKLVAEILKEAAVERLKKTMGDKIEGLTNELLDSLNNALD